MRLGKTTIVYLIFKITTSLSGFAATFYIARVFGADVLGIYTLVVSLLFWFRVPAGAISSALKKRLSENRTRGEFLTAGFVLMTLLAGTFALLLVSFRNWINAYIGAGVSTLLAVLLASDFAFRFARSALDGQQRVDRAGFVEAIERVLRTLFQIGLAILGYNIAGLILGHAGALLAGTLGALLFFEARPSLPSRDRFYELLRFGRYSWLGSLKTVAFGWMDTLVLGFFVTSSLIGIYNAAWTIGSALMLGSVAIRRTLFPELSELAVADEYDRIRHYLNEGLAFSGLIAIPGLFGAVVVGPRILRIYRPEFAAGTDVLVLLILAQVIASYGSQFVSAINAIDRPDVAFRINLAFISVNVTLNFGLVYLFGWVGAAVATLLSAVVTLGLGYFYFATLVDPPSIPYDEVGHQVFASTIMAVLVSGFSSTFPERNNYLTLGIVLSGAVIYVGVLLIISPRVRSKALSFVPTSEPR